MLNVHSTVDPERICLIVSGEKVVKSPLPNLAVSFNKFNKTLINPENGSGFVGQKVRLPMRSWIDSNSCLMWENYSNFCYQS